MRQEHRIPPLLVVGLVVLILTIGALAYYAGRFGRPDDRPARDDAAFELPPPGPPEPAVAAVVPTPAEVPPTVTPGVAAMIERETRTTRTVRGSAPLVERSSQVEVPVPAVIPTARFRDPVPTRVPTPRRPIVVQVVSTPVPRPTPTPEEVEPEVIFEDQPNVEEDPPVPEATPEPVPTSRPSRGLEGVNYSERSRDFPDGA
jgi:hypothetical protein